MLAFHNQPGVKSKFCRRLAAHHRMDAFIQGQYWSEGKGCAVGCTLVNNGGESGQGLYKEYELQLGIPRILAHIEDRIFEKLTIDEAKNFAVNFLKVIPVGADLTHVWEHFMAWLMEDILGRPRRKELPDYVKDSLTLVRGLFKEQAEGKNINWVAARKQTRVATDAAYAAAAYAAADVATDAAYAAAAAYAAYDAAAADAAADAAYDAAAYDAAYDAAYAATAYEAAQREFWTQAAAQLLHLLKTAPVPGKGVK